MKININKLKECTIEILLACGETEINSEIISEIMVKNDARGITTHGTHLLNPIFDRVKLNQFDLPTKASIVENKDATAVIDGGDGLGPVAATMAVKIAVEKAKKFGISSVLIRNTNNVGSLAIYTEMAAKEGMIAYFCCNASPAMSPWGGQEPFFGTQPFAFSIYAGDKLPFSADMSSSIVARGKIRKAAREGKEIPNNWAMDENGKFTTDPVEAIKGTLLPIGGPKGSAIALAIDIVAGMLSGSNYAPDVKPIHYPAGKAGVGCSLIVIDIAHFINIEKFTSNLSEYLNNVKELKKADGFDEILIPGEGKFRKEEKSIEIGVELDEKAIISLDKILKEINSLNRLQEQLL